MKINLMGKLFGMFKNKQEKKFSIYIGISKSVLRRVHSVSFQYPKAPMHDYAYRWKRAKEKLSIYPEEEPNPHIVMAGMSGIGKSTLLRSMLNDMKRSNVSCILFDSNNEHETAVKGIGGRVIEASSTGISLLALDGATIGDRIDELTNLFREVFSLGYLQAMKLNSCLWYTYMHKGARSRAEAHMEHAPAISDVLDELGIFIKRSKGAQEGNSLRSMYQKLSTLQRGAFRQSSINIEGIANGISSFSLASIGNEKARLIYISELIKRLYHYMHTAKKEHGISMYVVLDESQLILNNETGSRIIGNIIEEGRKFGFGAIIISHMASALDRRIIANASTFISFYAKEPGEINYVSSVLSGALPEMQNTIREKLRTLGKHEALLTSSTHKLPVLASTAHMFYPNNSSASDEHILSFLVQPMKRSALYSLIGAADLDEAIHRMEKSRALVSFTEGNDEWLMKYSRVLSIEHEVCVRKIAEKLRMCGIESSINTMPMGPDIVAHGIAIEYETGLKNIASTRQMLNNRKSYRKTLVIANDTHIGAYNGMGAVPYSLFMKMDCTSLSKMLSGS